MSIWQVWVGGFEISSYYIENKEEADKLASEYIQDGYDDVIVEEITDV